MTVFTKTFLLGVGFSDLKLEEVLEYIATSLLKSSKKHYIVTPNPELLVIAHDSPRYKSILNSAELALADGIGIIIGARILGKSIKHRITGVDLTESLVNYVSKRPITVGFLGSGPNIAELTSECLKRKYPELRVGLVSQDWNDSLKDKKVDILFIAFGSPKQETFIYENIENLPAKVVIGVGGTFDFISGKVARAPKILREIGLEWLFRLLKQPWRIKRQLRLLVFLKLIFVEKFFGK